MNTSAVYDKPTLSVIIPVYNAVSVVECAIKSVQECISNKGELILIDGGSTDGTVDIIKRFDHINNVRWISEPDKGIYDAMNKGIDLAVGQWLYFLGADDQLLHHELTDLIEHVPADCRAIFGKVQFENGYVMRSYLGCRTWLQNTVHHQAAIYHRTLFDKFRYDSHLKLLADYELNMRIFNCSLSTTYVDRIVALCNSGGASSDLSASMEETNIVRGRYVKSSWMQFLLSLLLTLYYSQKKVRRMLYGHKV